MEYCCGTLIAGKINVAYISTMDTSSHLLIATLSSLSVLAYENNDAGRSIHGQQVTDVVKHLRGLELIKYHHNTTSGTKAHFTLFVQCPSKPNRKYSHSRDSALLSSRFVRVHFGHTAWDSTAILPQQAIFQTFPGVSDRSPHKVRSAMIFMSQVRDAASGSRGVEFRFGLPRDFPEPRIVARSSRKW